MKLSNRTLWILILIWFVLSFYWFYKYFFELKLTKLEIISNISNFSWSLVNSKFEKDFSCITKECIIDELPPFEYELIIYKENYKIYKSNIILNNSKIIINLEKDIKLEKVETKKLSRSDLIDKIKNKNANVVDFSWNKIDYLEIYGNNNFVYFKKNDKLYFYNLSNNNSFNIEFIPSINYIKNISTNNLLIVTDIWSFTFNLLNKKIEYFSLFSDFILINGNYIWIINSDDLIRKKNFNFNNDSGNLIISYNIQKKESYILKNISEKIKKIYIEKSKIYIENNLWNKYEVLWY